MKIDIDEQKIVKEILETDGTLHFKIREEVKKSIVDEIKGKIDRELFRDSWHGQVEEIKHQVLDEIEEKQTEMVKKILKDFYNTYRYKKENLAILKELKKFIGEN